MNLPPIRLPSIFMAIAGLTGSLLLFSSTTAFATPNSPSPPEKNSPDPPSPSPPLASTTSSGKVEELAKASAEILELRKSKSSGFAYITVKIINNGQSENLHDHLFSNPTFIYREPMFSGITLLDNTEKMRHNPVMDEEEYCLCSGYSPRSPYAPFVRPGDSIDYWAMYSLPENTSSVDVEIPGFDPIEDVPVG